MAIKNTLERIESILGKDNLTKIHYTIPISVRLEVLGPSKKMIMGSVTRIA